MKAQEVWHGVTSAFASKTTQSIDLPPSQLRSRTPFVAPRISSPMQASSASKEPHTAPYCESSKCPAVLSSKSSLADTLMASHSRSPASSTSTSESIAITVLSYPRAFSGVIYRWYLFLRHAHVTAARQQAAERVQRIQQLDGDVNRQHPWGWGWEGFGWRSRVRATPSVETNENVGTTTKCECDEQDPQTVADWQTRRFDHGREAEDDDSEWEGNEKIRKQRSRMDHNCEDAGPNHRPPKEQPNIPLPPAAAVRPSSMWWWGPLWRWRLQDSTVY